jgi:8-oxo-dGTP pyrophosphatase MutT (NUDIX family)
MMHQMYKLFVNNKAVYFVTNPAHVNNILSIENEYIIQPYRNQKELQVLLENVLYNDANASDCVLFGKAPEKMLEEFLSLFICLEAAGGVVENNNGDILLIYRRGFWDLPKGKVDAGETLEQTAIREVEEETGLNQLRILKPVRFKNLLNTATYHSYILDGKPAMKIAYWYEMQTAFDGDPVPQTEEDIEEVIWVSKNNVADYYETMYPSIVDVLKAVLEP